MMDRVSSWVGVEKLLIDLLIMIVGVRGLGSIRLGIREHWVRD
jgi:hypothetical protein